MQSFSPNSLCKDRHPPPPRYSWSHLGRLRMRTSLTGTSWCVLYCSSSLTRMRPMMDDLRAVQTVQAVQTVRQYRQARESCVHRPQRLACGRRWVAGSRVAQGQVVLVVVVVSEAEVLHAAGPGGGAARQPHALHTPGPALHRQQLRV